MTIAPDHFNRLHMASVSTAPKAKKSLGQHFLKNIPLATRIVEHLDITQDDTIIEIGPGPGALTEHIVARRPKHLCLIEKDHAFAAMHHEHLPWADVRCQDALRVSWPAFTMPVKLISNLPYNVASPLMWDMLSQTPCWERAVFMVQREVAERIVAPLGTKAYGALTVWIQSYASVRMVLRVSPGAFVPPPKVDSAVILCLPRPLEDRPQRPDAFARMLKLCFQMRRKQVQNILRKAGFLDVDARIKALGLNPTIRPEGLSVCDFFRLTETFF